MRNDFNYQTYLKNAKEIANYIVDIFKKNSIHVTPVFILANGSIQAIPNDGIGLFYAGLIPTHLITPLGMINFIKCTRNNLDEAIGIANQQILEKLECKLKSHIGSIIRHYSISRLPDGESIPEFEYKEKIDCVDSKETDRIFSAFMVKLKLNNIQEKFKSSNSATNDSKKAYGYLETIRSFSDKLNSKQSDLVFLLLNGSFKDSHQLFNQVTDIMKEELNAFKSINNLPNDIISEIYKKIDININSESYPYELLKAIRQVKVFEKVIDNAPNTDIKPSKLTLEMY